METDAVKDTWFKMAQGIIDGHLRNHTEQLLEAAKPSFVRRRFGGPEYPKLNRWQKARRFLYKVFGHDDPYYPEAKLPEPVGDTIKFRRLKPFADPVKKEREFLGSTVYYSLQRDTEPGTRVHCAYDGRIIQGILKEWEGGIVSPRLHALVELSSGEIRRISVGELRVDWEASAGKERDNVNHELRIDARPEYIGQLRTSEKTEAEEVEADKEEAPGHTWN